MLTAHGIVIKYNGTYDAEGITTNWALLLTIIIALRSSSKCSSFTQLSFPIIIRLITGYDVLWDRLSQFLILSG